MINLILIEMTNKKDMMTDIMKEEVPISLKVDMNTGNEIMFKNNTHHQKITMITDIKKDTQSPPLDHHPHLLPVRHQGEVVAETIKGIMKTEVDNIQKDKKEKEIKFMSEEKKVNTVKMKTDKRIDLMV